MLRLSWAVTIAFDQEDGHPLVEVPDLLRLLLPSVPGQGCVQLLELHHSGLLQTPLRLHHHGDEDHAWQGGLEGLHYCDIQGPVFPVGTRGRANYSVVQMVSSIKSPPTS